VDARATAQATGDAGMPMRDRLIRLGLRHFVAVVAVLGLIGFVTSHAWDVADPVIRSDAYSYYVYLPAWLLHHDPDLSAVADECCGGEFPEWSAIRRWPGTGRWVNPHPIGVAIQMAPAFAVAHLLTRWSNLPASGFSLYYQIAAGLSGLAAVLIGLALLRRQLSREFTPGVVLAALVTLTFGTNLFHYGVFDAPYSHAFSFLLIAALVTLTDRWWRDPSWVVSFGLASVAGLIVLTRHTNGLYLLVVPLYGISALGGVRPAAAACWRRREMVLAMLAVGAAWLAPQAFIYKASTGQWVVSAYDQVGGFTFASPHLWGVLFSTQKGLFLWSPVLLLAVAGVFVATGPARHARSAAVLVFVLTTYLIASWFDWQFGGSFGHRGYTDGLALAALFLASAFAWIARRPRLVPVAAVVVAALVALSVAQMMQYWMGILPFQDITWAQYRDLFLRFR